MLQNKKLYGEFLTPKEIFKNYILPEIENDIYKYRWVDLFCGEGNLILPILELVDLNERNHFFENHIFLFDIQKSLVEKAILNAIKYGIKESLARKNIIQMDTIKHYPNFILNTNLLIYHITNPPYLYIGHIAKSKSNIIDYFKRENEGYQDLYQLALMNDLRNNIKKMIYIIPANFLFGFSVSNKIRKDFLKFYKIKKCYIFERRVFEDTGTNVILCFFERKQFPKDEEIIFEGIKINNSIQKRVYILSPKNYYRAGNEFEEFVNKYKSKKPLKVSFYFTKEEFEKNKGDREIVVLDVNEYKNKVLNVNEELYKKIKSNILFVRTLDTGKMDGRVGLYEVKEVFNVDGIFVSKSKHRTHPIQIFFEPIISKEHQKLLKNYFNLLLEYFREKTDSEFMTTYKYSNSQYTRKYLGLLQVKNLIETFPILLLNENDLKEFEKIVNLKDAESVISFIESFNKKEKSILWH